MTSPKRERSSSPMDMETSSDEEEDGQISKLEEEEEKDRKLYGKHNPEEEPITMLDLEKCRVTRDALAKHCMVPWFEDYVKGRSSYVWPGELSHIFARRVGPLPHWAGGR
jgi:RNA polymerase-associated protein RTF1